MYVSTVSLLLLVQQMIFSSLVQDRVFSGLLAECGFCHHHSDCLCSLHLHLTEGMAAAGVETESHCQEDVERGSLLSSACLTAYCTYLCFSALERYAGCWHCNVANVQFTGRDM